MNTGGTQVGGNGTTNAEIIARGKDMIRRRGSALEVDAAMDPVLSFGPVVAGWGDPASLSGSEGTQ